MSIISQVGGAAVFSSASGGKVTGFNNIHNVTPVVVAAANTSRRRLTFHNPGTENIYVYPTVNAAGAANAPTVAAPGGSFLIFANGGALTVEGEIQGAWAALAAAGTTNPLTVMDSNV